MKKALFALCALLALAALIGCKNKSADVPVTQGGGTGLSAPVMADTDAETRVLKDVLKNDPKNVDALIKLGNLYMDTNRFADAIDSYGRALVITPNNVDVRVDMGTCYRRLGHPDTAVQEYRKALTIDPRHLNAHMNLGVVLEYDIKDNKGALAEFEKYMELAPNSPNAPAVKEEIAKLTGGSHSK